MGCRWRVEGVSAAPRQRWPIVCNVCSRKSKCFRAPSAPESPSLGSPRESNHCAAGAARTAKPARRAEGRMPGVKRKRPSSALAGHSARQVREPRPGFSTVHSATAPALLYLRHPCRRHALAKRHRHPCRCPCGPHRPRLTASQGRWRSRSTATATATASPQHQHQHQHNNAKAMVIASAIAEPLRARRAAFDLPSPLQRRPGGGKARRVARMDASQFGVSPWMDCRQTPQPGRVPHRSQTGEARKRGGLSLGYFSLATQREVTRPPKEDETAPCPWPGLTERSQDRDGFPRSRE